MILQCSLHLQPQREAKVESEMSTNGKTMIKNVGEMKAPPMLATEENYSARKCRHVKCKCAYKCPQNINEEDQITIFSEYWGMKSFARQRDFIAHHVEMKRVMRRTTNETSRRNFSKSYSFTLRDQRILVCKAFFLGTLDIREKTVHYTLVKKKNEQGLTSPDKRGRHAPGIQIAEEEKSSSETTSRVIQ